MKIQPGECSIFFSCPTKLLFLEGVWFSICDRNKMIRKCDDTSAMVIVLCASCSVLEGQESLWPHYIRQGEVLTTTRRILKVVMPIWLVVVSAVPCKSAVLCMRITDHPRRISTFLLPLSQCAFFLNNARDPWSDSHFDAGSDSVWLN